MALWEILIVVGYLLLVGYLGFLGWQRTRSTSDYLLAGRKAHPVIMALSYGSTFISTSAIVGFGGAAGMFGMSLLWLTFCNIFVGIFIAFVLLGGPTRRIGHRLDAHTFPEFLSRRYESRFIQIFAGLVIFLLMPLYAMAVLVGGSEFISSQFAIDYEVALLIFAVLTAAYVMVGGLKGVMYTDALQATIMVVGMAVLLIFTYSQLGGVTEAHQTLSDLSDLVPAKLAAGGHQGWTAMPAFGFGAAKYNLWWTVISTIVLGVGIGVLAQPQLVVRFMTVKNTNALTRATLVGGIFILCMTGVAFTVGALSNAYFATKGQKLFEGQVVRVIDAEKGHAVVQPGAWGQPDREGEAAPWVGQGGEIAVVLTADSAGAQVGSIASGRSVAAVVAGGNTEQIIPTFIREAMPHWFGIVFLLTLLAAAMSTLSGQFHTLGTGIGHDVLGQFSRARGIGITRLGMVVGILLAVTLSYRLRGTSLIVARATAIFFGICASAFLPAFVGGLFWRRATRPAAIASMVVGTVVTAFWLSFIKDAEAQAIGLCKLLTGKTSLLLTAPNWPVVDPLVIALPLSAVTFVVVTLLTKPPSQRLLQNVFGKGPVEVGQAEPAGARALPVGQAKA